MGMYLERLQVRPTVQSYEENLFVGLFGAVYELETGNYRRGMTEKPCFINVVYNSENVAWFILNTPIQLALGVLSEMFQSISIFLINSVWHLTSNKTLC